MAAQAGGEPQRLSTAARQALHAYDFPGNVRELENILERATALSDAPVLDLADLRLPEPQTGPRNGTTTDAPAPQAQPAPSKPPDPMQAEPRAAATADPDLDIGDRPLEAKLDEIEKKAILKALDATHWNRTAAAKLLGMTPRSLRYRLGKLGLD
jgi:two-component system response regulator PilR (NtrC family)